MERFGIFELLDALSSAPARENAPANYLTEEDGAPAGGAADGSADNRASGGHPNIDGTAVPSPAPQALESFLRRHDTVSKKVDKKK